jgi:hypothetical protein
LVWPRQRRARVAVVGAVAALVSGVVAAVLPAMHDAGPSLKTPDPSGGSATPAALEPTWAREVGELVEGERPWLSQVLNGGETWVARVIAGEGTSAFVPLDPATGQGPSEPATPVLPEDVFCADNLRDGDLVCAWDDAIYAIDSTTGSPRKGTLARQRGVHLWAVEVAERELIAVGSRGQNPVVSAFAADGRERWSKEVAAQGCDVDSPEYQADVEVNGSEARIALAAYRLAVDLETGRVLIAACGLAAFTPSGAMAVAQVHGDEPAPPASYAGADGESRRVLNAGLAAQVVGFAAGGREYWAVIDTVERLRLYDAASGAQLWELSWQYGRVQTWDGTRLYATSRQGLRAVDLDSGHIAWTFAGEPGMSVRSALMTQDAGLVVATSSGVSGLDPAGGVERWAVADPYLAGWYWTPAGITPEAARTTDTVGFIDTEHGTFTRLDAPRG